jgi:hypothetical protein
MILFEKEAPMKLAGKAILAIVLILPLMVGGLSVRAASEAEIESAVEAGLAWLAADQAPDGCWYGMSTPGDTGLAVLKFEERARDLGMDPFDPAYPYHAQVENGLNCIFSMLDTDDGFVWAPDFPVYNTGIDMMALAASANPGRVVTAPGPVMGWTYQEVLQGMLDWMEDAQNDGGCEIGGWGYDANMVGWSDNSNSGWATLGIGFATSPAYGFGLTVDPNVLAKLDMFIDNVQDPATGASHYSPCDMEGWFNILKQGHLLYEMKLVGRPLADPTVQAAIGFIEDAWNAPPDPGWVDYYQAMFTLMKGLEAYNVQTLTVGGSDIDWFDEVSTYIVTHQNPDGSSGPGYGFGAGDPVLETSWALLTLERVVPPFEVEIDIKPWSYPNSINLKSKGVIPVAILSTEDFDATTVDPESVMFADASPVHYAVEDVDHDGDYDLILHFRTQDTSIAPGDMEACLIGETYDGVAIVGCDSVRTVPEM